MKCNSCSHDTRVLSTRTQAEFFIVRRHECTGPKHHRFNTVEMLQTVVHTQRLWLMAAVERANRGVHRRRREADVRERIVAALTTQPKTKQIVVAAEIGCCERLVRKVAGELRRE